MPFRDFVNQHKDYACTTLYPQQSGKQRDGTIVCTGKGEAHGKEYRYEYKANETFVVIDFDKLTEDQNISRCDYLLLNTTGINTNQTDFHSIFVELNLTV